MKSHRIFAMVALLTVVLTGCSVLTPDKRPDDERLRDGINLLLRATTRSWLIGMRKS